MALIRRFILGSFLLQMLLPPLPGFAQGAPKTLRDKAIEYVTDSGMLPRGLDGSFRANDPMTRMEFLSLLVNDVYFLDDKKSCFSDISSRPGRKVRYTHLFSDVSIEASFAGDLCIGMLVGLAHGRRDGTFGAGTAISFAEAAKWTTKAYGIAPKPSLRSHSSVPWHEPFRHAVAQRGAVPDSVKNVHQMLTKGEAAELLYLLRIDKPSYGYKYRQDMREPVSLNLNNDFDKRPVQSVKVRFVSPSNKGVLTIRFRKATPETEHFGRLTARTRRQLLRSGQVNIYDKALIEKQKSDQSKRITFRSTPAPIGRDWKFISPEDRPTARTIHREAEKRYRESK